MGKVKSATLGGSEEQELRDKKKRQREEKKKREESGKVHISGSKGGEKMTMVGAASEEEMDKMATLAREQEEFEKEGAQGKSEKKEKFKKKHTRSKKYQEVMTKIEHGKVYDLKEAVSLLRDVHIAKFDETVEVHMNVSEKGLRGTVTLPHGTGKKIRVVIADNSTIDKLVSEVEKGIFEFDALVAHPQVMPKLGKIARFLGPKGLMPNPKNGTISTSPEKVAEKLKAGEISWKTEPEFPLIHQAVGKLSFKDAQLVENITTLIKSVGDGKIQNMTIKSTMSPGIKVNFSI